MTVDQELCQKKRHYPTWSDATRALDRICMEDRNPQSSEFMHVYKCDVCHQYHVGHDRVKAARSGR